MGLDKEMDEFFSYDTVRHFSLPYFCFTEPSAAGVGLRLRLQLRAMPNGVSLTAWARACH